MKNAADVIADGLRAGQVAMLPKKHSWIQEDTVEDLDKEKLKAEALDWIEVYLVSSGFDAFTRDAMLDAYLQGWKAGALRGFSRGAEETGRVE